MDNFILKPLEWDTAFFGMKCAKAVLNEALTEKELEDLLVQCKEYEFVTVENSCGAFSNDFYLGEKSEAYMTDCPVLLKKDAEKHPKEENSSFIIRKATEEDLPELAKIAEGAFVESRFFNDPEIPDEKAGELYSSWVKNAFYSENKTVFTTDERNGFLIYVQRDGEGHIDLVAAGGENRKKGVGTALVKFAENYAFEQGCGVFFVGTQATNIPALNLYIKCGFKIIKTSRIYHLRNY